MFVGRESVVIYNLGVRFDWWVWRGADHRFGHVGLFVDGRSRLCCVEMKGSSDWIFWDGADWYLCSLDDHCIYG